MSSDDNGTSPPTSEAAAFLSLVLSATTTRTETLPKTTRIEFEDTQVEGTLLRARDDGVIHLNSYKKKE